MHKLDQRGEANGFLISTIVLALLFITATVMSVMFYGKYTDNRDNVDKKVSEAVAKAKDEQTKQLQAEFDEKEKNPLETYESPANYGSIKVSYPKTWSASVDETGGSSSPIKGYFHPKFVPATNAKVKYALRVELVNQQYATFIKSFDNQIHSGKLQAAPITISGAAGTRFDGAIDSDTNGAVVVLPLRDKSLKVWTESKEYLGDFNDIILKNLTFTP